MVSERPESAWPLLEWAPEIGAASYGVYESRWPLDGGASPAGDCYHQSVRTRYTPLKDLPLAGEAFGFLVAANMSGGEGSLGSSSDGSPRVPGTSCP